MVCASAFEDAKTINSEDRISMSRIPMLIAERTLDIAVVLLSIVSVARDSGYSLPTSCIYVKPLLLDCLSKIFALSGLLSFRESNLSEAQFPRRTLLGFLVNKSLMRVC